MRDAQIYSVFPAIIRRAVMKCRFFCFWLFLFLTLHTVLFAQEMTEQNNVLDKVALKIDLPLFDLPYQTNTMQAMEHAFLYTYTSPSMNQSLALTMGVYSSMHYGIKKMYDSLTFAPLYKNLIYAGSTAAGILAFAYVFPFGYPWLKQQYIHSVFSQHGIASYANSGAYYIGVTDSQLNQLKANAPYDFIRMNVTGMEAYNIFSDTMMRNSFFYDLENLSFVPAFITVFLNFSSNVSLVLAHELGAINVDVDAIDMKYKNDSSNQGERFLTGVDAINWVYDLFRPNEPYSARGQHPSGDGSVARYIHYAQLTKKEKNYLILQMGLQYLNFVSPLLYSIRSFHLWETGLEGNFALRHYLTSFGADIPASFFLKYRQFNMAFTYHSYFNYENYFPAIEAELIDYPINIGKFSMFISPRVLIGAQPKNQEFKTASPEFLGLFGLRVDFRVSNNVLPYFDFTAKTNGWIAGNEYLKSSVGLQTGVSLRF